MQQIFHLSVNSKLPRASASITPACDTLQVVPSTSLTHHWSPTVSLARINSTLIKPSADHGVVDLSWVGSVATSTTYDRYWSLLKFVRSSASRCKPPPACDPASGTVSWRGYGVWKTYQIYVSKKGITNKLIFYRRETIKQHSNTKTKPTRILSKT